MATEKLPGYSQLFRSTFQEASAFLWTKLDFEKRANRNNMDSGIPLEDYFRSILGQFLPNEFAIDCGTIIDPNYVTAGDYDAIIYNPWYAPRLKLPAADGSRRKIFPNEVTYGVVEVKQTLTDKSLPAACEKI